jgi:hypothetical protein
MAAARDYRAGKLSPNSMLTEAEIKFHESLPRVDRIVLYIDDLDRCPPKQVIEVLQAIHLLLAFDLFVVIVGVDPRWISRSLKMHYPELLGDDSQPEDQPAKNGERHPSNPNGKEPSSNEMARPLDYLEKIFQIPFWIRPIGGLETGSLIQGILGPARAHSTAANETRSAEAQPNVSPTLDTPPTIPMDNRDETPLEARAKTTDALDSVSTAPDDEVAFIDVTLTQDETEFMSGLRRLAGTTPRAIKRYVNIYRLLRARVSKTLAQQFEGKTGEPREFEAVMFLLAMFNTSPFFAHLFCKELEKHKASEQEKNPDSEKLITPLLQLMADIEKNGNLEESEVAFIRALKTYSNGFKPPAPQPDIDPFCRWHRVVSRDSFVGGSPTSGSGRQQRPRICSEW